MSRIGKKSITLAEGVTLIVQDNEFKFSGPKGSLVLNLNPRIKVKIEGQTLTVSVPNPNNRFDRSLWGLGRQLLANAAIGVKQGFEKRLEIHGVGFKASLQGSNLQLNLGFSHPVIFTPPKNITLAVEKNVIIVSGVDKQLVGETAAEIRRLKPPEPYKGKGIKYAEEVVRRKAGKVVKAAGAK
ncbi:50S ribosomal protein L6 [Candidatus Parcubacteria bacterium]|nr:MAG: 50S ribosomal protein L6 [Candidatus Parcubacteria bacterium]